MSSHKLRIIRLILAACMFGGASGSWAYEFPAERSKIDSPKTAKLTAISEGVAEIADKSGKALVFVSVAKMTRGMPRGQINPFEFFFGFPGPHGQNPHQQPQQPAPERRQTGLGSGFFVDLNEGYILTNNHVIDDADEIEVKLANGRTYEATVVGRDKSTDVAVVKIKDSRFERKGLATLSFADSEKVKVGDFVVALGAPFGLEATVTFGVVSALNRADLDITDLGNFIQTDAAVNPGNSGGPLINSTGEVIGINSAIFSKAGGYNGISFAIPSNLVTRIAKSLIETGKVNRGFMGVNLQPLNDDLRKSFELGPDVDGALITKVQKAGPADEAGVEEGDVIFEVNGKAARSPREVSNLVGLSNPGSEIPVKVYRGGKVKELTITLDDYPDTDYRSKSTPAAGTNLGLSLKELNDGYREQNKVETEEGLVVVGIDPKAKVARTRLRLGDVIVSLNNKPVANLKEFRSHINKNGSNLMRVERSGNFFYISVVGDVG